MIFEEYNNCHLCPRDCGVNRNLGHRGVCGVTGKLKVARAALHYWEEPCISGKNGSGAVFFSGCCLHCVFCQNEQISWGKSGKEISVERLAEIFLELQEQNANNINLVTPGQFLPHIIYAVEIARRQGLIIPLVYNSSGYEHVETLKRLEGIVDVYLPDFKYLSSDLSLRYSHAEDYSLRAKEALAEMIRQQPMPLFYKEQLRMDQDKDRNLHTDFIEGDLIRRGVIVRQLLLPGQRADAKKIVRYLHETYSDRIYISMMSQFTPLSHFQDYPELNSKISVKDYEKYIDFAMQIGVEQGFVQDGECAEESFIPAFDCRGV